MIAHRSVLMVGLLCILLGVVEVPGFVAAVRTQNIDASTASPLTTVSAIRVNLTDAAINKGAVCLDGSPAAYYFKPGTGNGSNNWIIELEGGGWCYDMGLCFQRANTTFGTTLRNVTLGEIQAMSTGIMDNNPEANPDFYNWNMVFVLYCDGASFSGDVGTPVEKPEGKLYFRGQRIWDAVITDLLYERGMQAADKYTVSDLSVSATFRVVTIPEQVEAESVSALLTGCSAGGLAALIHCDEFQARMPTSTGVKCFSDAGYFLDQEDVAGNYSLRKNFQSVVALQNVTYNLSPKCISAKNDSEAWQCFFPEYFIQYITTPFFIVNSGYDSWQIPNSLIPEYDWGPENGTWKACYENFSNCSSEQFDDILGFRNHMTSSLIKLLSSSNLDKSGVFETSCRVHCVEAETYWNNNGSGGVHVTGVTPSMAVGDWYFCRNKVMRILIDQASPTNSSCSNGGPR